MTLATKITLARIALIPVFLVCFLVAFPYHYLVAGIIYAVIAITDMLDGQIARKTHTVSDLGKILDPIADKALSITAMLCCVFAELFYFNVAFIVMVAIMIAREFGISLFRMYALKTGKTLAADIWGKLKTIFLNVSIPVVVIVNDFEYLTSFHTVFKWIGSVCFFIAFILTVLSAVNYLVINREVLKEAFAQKKEGETQENEEQGDEK